jgi:hypothetical protein
MSDHDGANWVITIGEMRKHGRPGKRKRGRPTDGFAATTRSARERREMVASVEQSAAQWLPQEFRSVSEAIGIVRARWTSKSAMVEG